LTYPDNKPKRVNIIFEIIKGFLLPYLSPKYPDINEPIKKPKKIEVPIRLSFEGDKSHSFYKIGIKKLTTSDSVPSTILIIPIQTKIMY